MRGEPRAQIGDPATEAAAFANADDPHRPDRLAGRTEPLKPGDPREIIGAGHRRRGGRHQPRAQGYPCAGHQSGRRFLLLHIDANQRGNGHLTDRHELQPDAAPRRQSFDADDPRFERSDHGPFDSWGGNPLDAKPDQSAADHGDQGKDPYDAAQSSAARQGEAETSHAPGGCHERQPLAHIGQGEPCRDEGPAPRAARAESDRAPPPASVRSPRRPHGCARTALFEATQALC